MVRAADHLPERWNAAAWFIGRHVAEGRGGDLAIVTDDETLTYAELDDRVRRFAGALAAAGVRRGERVAIILPDGPAHAVAFWGTLAHGAVAVPLNPLLRPHEHAAIVADCEPLLIVDAASAFPPPAEAAGYAPVHRDAFAFMLYSSGTTGEPKGVVHLHHDMWVCARTYGREVLETVPGDRCFSVAKLFFAYGLGNAGYFPFDVGAAAILFAGRPAPDAVFAQVARHRPTLFFGVPTAYAQMLAAMDGGAAADFSSVRRCVSAGEALPPSLHERWRERTGLEILDGIGSTEACHIFVSGRAGATVPGATGLPVAGYEVRIVDEQGADVPPGAIGDLLVSGDSTMAFYWQRHEATKHALAGAWLRTGDKYRRDEAGQLWHAGRSDDMLKCRGQWVSPVEVEAVLSAHPAVLECAVIGRADADGLVKPHAFVTLRAGGVWSDALAAELLAHARAGLAAHKAPSSVSQVAELPRTATGKLQRFKLR